MKNLPKKQKLSNPAAIAAISSEQGQNAIKTASENQKAVVQATASVIPFVLKTVFVLGVGYFVYSSWADRFVPSKEVPYYPQSNITSSQAKTKAEAIYGAMKGFGNGFQVVAANIAGLNYNGWVRLYNAFGNRQGIVPFSGETNLVEWFADQFDEEELAQLRFLVPNAF
jgi:alpha-acetolactate decarboxylase